MDRLTRIYVMLWSGVAVGVIIAATGLVLVLNAYVPPTDILTADGRPVPFFETIKPVPLGVGIVGILVIAVFAVALLRGRAREYW